MPYFNAAELCTLGPKAIDPLHRFGLADQGCQAAIEAAIVRTIRNRAWPAIIFA